MLFYKTFRSRAGNNSSVTPLIFLHGFLGSGLDWMPIIGPLKKNYPCIAIDLPAHGNSKYSETVFLKLEETLLAFSHPPPILIGYSLGGRLAFSYGQKHPEKIRGLIALSAHTGLKTSQEREKRALQDLAWQERLQTLSSHEFLALWYQQLSFSSLHKKPKLLAFEKLLKTREYHNPKELASVLEQISLSKQPLYETFDHPICFLFGEEDRSYADLYASMPFPKKEIKQAGHTVHLENPLACVEAIQEVAILLQ